MNKIERTLVLLKPDAVQRNLIGEIISRFEKVGLKVIAMKFLIPSREIAYRHYAKSEEEVEALGRRSLEANKKNGIVTDEDPKVRGQIIIDRLVDYLSCSPVVALVLEGHNAIAITRKLVGSTEPLNSDVGTIRGDFTLDSYTLSDADKRAVRNLVHASANEFDAQYEIKLWFKDDELFSYHNIRDAILYEDHF